MRSPTWQCGSPDSANAPHPPPALRAGDGSVTLQAPGGAKEDELGGIFGIFNRDGRPLEAPTLQTMRDSMAHWGRDGCGLWHDGPAGLGQMRTWTLPESRLETLPKFEPQSRVAFTAWGRVDNRDELGSALGLAPGEQAGLPDSELLRLTYLRRGAECCGHILGDWSFAAWHARERRLFLARDPHGSSAISYFAGEREFVFASDKRALLELGIVPRELDELFLAQVMVGWMAFHGDRTAYRSVRRLPAAHWLQVSPERLEVRRYWRAEDTPLLVLPRRDDYARRFLEIFDEAVRARLRCSGEVGCTLSAGLDSGAVAATAAPLLDAAGKRLLAFTSVPCHESADTEARAVKNEWPLAAATAAMAGNVEHLPIAAGSLSPVRAIRQLLSLTGEPWLNAGNAYWLLDLARTARQRGCGVLLTGDAGNATISWCGVQDSLPLWARLRRLGPRAVVRRAIRDCLPMVVRRARWRRGARPELERLHRSCALRADFVARIHLLERRLDDPDEGPASGRLESRRRLLLPGRSRLGDSNAVLGAASGLSITDPTSDPRVLALTWSFPDEVFIDTATGLERWLVRDAMQGRLPDEVRFNQRRGWQASDLVARLRACASEVEEALTEIESGSAPELLDLPRMRQVWVSIQSDDSVAAYLNAISILCRGLMAGLLLTGQAALTPSSA